MGRRDLINPIHRVNAALETLRTLREGMQFGYHLPSDPTGPPAAAAHDMIAPPEDYFDSVSEGPGIWKWRHYFPIYHRHLEKFVGREVHIVEVGVFSGGSLPMWHAYFGEKCHVYGVDIDPACTAHEGERTKVSIGDQADAGFWAEFVKQVPRIDVVIDDGGHEAYQQIATLRALLEPMAMGGVYICEDIVGATQQFHSFVDGLTRPLSVVEGSVSAAEPIHQHVASVHHYPMLTVIEKPDRRMDGFISAKRGTVWQPPTL